MNGIERIKEELKLFNKEDAKNFKDSIDELCAKGVGKGCYQDYKILCSIVGILSICEEIIKNEELKAAEDEEAAEKGHFYVIARQLGAPLKIVLETNCEDEAIERAALGNYDNMNYPEDIKTTFYVAKRVEI